MLDEGEERYQFIWPDKRAASRLANEPTDKTLRPDIEASVDFWNTENLYIEGDNLDVLKVLRENYLGKVKMIYIDPPYNTGNDFVYNDDFAQTREDFEATNGAFDEEGNLMIDPMQRNTESNGRFHTDWLNMIYPRLKVARDLLSEDGAIFVTLDDNEVYNCRKVMDEIFGANNFVATIIWENFMVVVMRRQFLPLIIIYFCTLRLEMIGKILEIFFRVTKSLQTNIKIQIMTPWAMEIRPNICKRRKT